MLSLAELQKNKKTYALAAMIILIVVCEKLLAIDIPGIEVGDDWLQYILTGLGLGTLRAAISKAIGTKIE